MPTENSLADARCEMRANIWRGSVNFTFGPLSNSGPGSYAASIVCFSSSNGCMMLDLPELLAPASSVNGLISIVCSFTRDLKPLTVSD